MNKNNYISKITAYCMIIVHARFAVLLKILFLLILIFSFSGNNVKADDRVIGEEEVLLFSYDDIPVRVIVEGYNNFFVDAIYTNTNVLFINFEDLFKTLSIPCVAGPKGNSFSGFIEHESQAYLIDYEARQIIVGGKTIDAKNRLIKETGSLYLESSLFAEAFGITLPFNYRSLSIVLKSNFELPVVRQQRIEKLRSNMSKIKGEVTADTVIKRDYHLFRFGTLDWSAASTQSWNAPSNNLSGEQLPETSSRPWKETTNNRFGFGLGTELFYGEANVSVNYYDRQKFNNRQLQYLWRWVDNDKRIIKQAQVGKIFNQSISFLNSQVIGAVIRNSPTTVRKAKGYYAIDEYTEPNWIVELYINDVLVDYAQADASGLYMFKVPIVYGYTTLKLKFYGPLGEERTEERTMNVPYTVMPVNEFEYNLAGGLLQDSSLSRFGRGEFNYGVNRLLTVGGGLEYLSSIANGAYIPFATATIQPFTKLTLNGEYAHGVRTRGLLNYYFRKDILFELDYTKYVEGQMATRFNAPEERKAKLSVPLRLKKVSGFAKFDYTQLVYKAFNYNQASVMFSAYYRQISANTTTQFNWIGEKTAYVTNELALSYRLRNGIVIRPAARYNVSDNRLLTYKIAFEKTIPKGNVSVSYERNVLYKDNYLNVNFRYDLPFARTSVSAFRSKSNVSVSENAQGSMAFGSGNKNVHVSNNASVGKGGISLYPFLDLNQNGVFDAGEQMVKLNTVKISGGRAIFSEKDSIIRIPELNPFTSYNLEFKDNDLENISWRFKTKSYQVLIDPNQFKRINIPVVPVGEITGMVYREKGDALKGIGRILVKFYKKGSRVEVAQALSESDGYLYFLGLEPGAYVARVDSLQLSILEFAADPPQRDFTIKTLRDGDMVRGIDFVLRPVQNDSLAPEPKIDVAAADDKNSPASEPLLQMGRNIPARSGRQVNSQTEGTPHLTGEDSIVKDPVVYNSEDTLYKVQLLALRKPIKVKSYFTKLLAAVPGLTIEEKLGEDGLYHYSTKAFVGIEESREFQRTIRKSGWKDSFVAVYAGELRAEMAFRLRRAKATGESAKKIPAKQLLSRQEKAIPIIETAKPIEQQRIIHLQGLKSTQPERIMQLEEKFSPGRDTLAHRPGDPVYKVQLMALRAPIRVKGYFAKLLADVPGLTIEELQTEDGLYQYSSGAFNRISEARKVKQLIMASGWKDCFISVYTGDATEEAAFRIKKGIRDRELFREAK